MKRNLLALLMVFAVLLSGCNNQRAEEPAKWHLSLTWGDKTLPAPAQQHDAAPAAKQAEAPITSTAGCPTTGEVKTLTGVDVQRLATEPCAFVWRGTPPATVVATCPTGWVCTWDVVGDVVVVHLGVGQKATIRAGTWRYINAYPPSDAVHDVCVLYAKEKAFGLSENPPFEVRFQPVTDGTRGPVGPQSCNN
jgi:hypothetical protein